MARPNNPRCSIDEDEVERRLWVAANPKVTLHDGAKFLGISPSALSRWCIRNKVEWAYASTPGRRRK